MIVDHQIVILAPVGYLFSCGIQPLLDHRGCICVPVPQTPLEFLEGRGQQENADGFRQAASDLTVAPHVNVQQNIVSRGLSCLELVPSSPVEMAVNVCPFDELLGGDHPLEPRRTDKKILPPIVLAGAARPGSKGYGETQSGEGRNQAFYKS